MLFSFTNRFHHYYLSDLAVAAIVILFSQFYKLFVLNIISILFPIAGILIKGVSLSFIGIST